MNRYFYTFVLSLLTLTLSAQGYKCERIGLIQDGDSYFLSYPTTTISVELLVEKEVVTPGIYARYAQKYLSQRAPLTQQSTYRIIGATVDALDSNKTTNHLTPKEAEVEYTPLPIDQYSSELLAAEIAARDAASAIFTIRRQRRDIINGEAGEGYFGAGLEDAMSRLDEMEREYVELFMGKRAITQSVMNFAFTPVKDSHRFVVARFDSKSGVLPASDLVGAPIYIEFSAMELPDTSSIELRQKNSRSFSRSIDLSIAAQTQCTLYNDSEVVTSTVLPIYEFGKVIMVNSK